MKLNIRSIFNQMLPPACVLCGGPTHGEALCPGCHADLPWHTAPHCPQCALPTPDGQLCGACLRHPPAFDRTRAALVYAFPADRMIPRLKYAGRLALAPALGACLVHRLAEAPRPDRLVPMPLHPARLRQRGFNHAVELARPLARQLGGRLDTGLCTRVRDTPPQMQLRHDARRRNVRGAFTCTARLDGARIAIVDDVMTTGASLDELAAALKRAGAAAVECWVLARALPPGESRP